MTLSRLTAGTALTLLLMGVGSNAKAVAPEGSPNPAIVTESGPLKGLISPSIRKFLGIPYAAPPLAERRWTPPRPYGRWHGVFQATQFGNSCPQRNFFGTLSGDEDCLSLNVYTPGFRKNEHKHHGLPVMVWIHGGSLTEGSGGLYDPTPLVEKGGVIVVTINYRLGVLGFLAHPALDAEGHLNANYGLMDQQFALKWVRRNIAAFGGDPRRVTIFGESAGGYSVYSHLASPTAARLFHRAIAQSGAYDSFQSYQQRTLPLAVAEIGGTAFATAIGCDNQTTQCLRTTSATALVTAQPGIVYPAIDGTVLTQTPGAALASGQFNRVPVMSGSNYDEWRLYVALGYDYVGAPLTDAGYPTAVASFIGLPLADPFVQFVLFLYPLINYPPPPGVVSAPLALGAVGTDVVFSCPGRKAARSLSQYVPTYAYEFNDANAPLNFGLVPASFPLGSYHAAEIQYLLNIGGTPAPFTASQQQLSDTMIGYWTRFAKTGNPNSLGAPAWSPYNTATDRFQSLVPPTPTGTSNFDTDHKCSSFWDTF
ncbi:MAG: carboxylesterase family protein [Deltaproteobacteria bacterium]|nr:carboxylesterase family protein [Deltaproteobacteria bacterium]